MQYLYDASGQRVKKLNRKQLGSDWDVVVYIDGVLEQRTQQRGATTKQGVVLHVLDGGKRLGMRRTGETFDAKPENLLVLSDHLGSGSVELDWSLGDFIDREEFRPYGETSFGSYAHKRYRFTGKERDEESGLNYHGARYYAPGLARWMSPDPKGLVDGVNLYGYVRGNPVGNVDHNGCESEERPSSKLSKAQEKIQQRVLSTAQRELRALNDPSFNGISQVGFRYVGDLRQKTVRPQTLTEIADPVQGRIQFQIEIGRDPFEPIAKTDSRTISNNELTIHRSSVSLPIFEPKTGGGFFDRYIYEGYRSHVLHEFGHVIINRDKNMPPGYQVSDLYREYEKLMSKALSAEMAPWRVGLQKLADPGRDEAGIEWAVQELAVSRWHMSLLGKSTSVEKIADKYASGVEIRLSNVKNRSTPSGEFSTKEALIPFYTKLLESSSK